MSTAVMLEDVAPVMPEGPLADPGSWKSADFPDPAAWQYRLDEEDVADLKAALAQVRARGLAIMEIGKDDFPLPRFGARLARLRREILEGRGFVLLRGVPLEGCTKAEAATLYWGIGVHLGYPVSQNARGHLLGHVTDLGVKSMAAGESAEKERPFLHTEFRSYMSRERIFFHVDFADIVGLLCLHPARTGGLSIIASALAIHNEIMARRPDLLRVLYEPFWVDRRREVPAGAKPYYRMPVFHYYGGRLSVHYARGHIQTSESFPELPRLSAAQTEALHLVDELANDPAFHISMQLERGDLQFLNNHVIVHARTKYEDFPEPERKRYLLRLWLVTPDGRPLSHWFYDQFGAGRRGGIYVPGAVEAAPLDP